MTPTSSSCPAPEKLADLAANALSEAEADRLRRHIASCPDCQARLSRSETSARHGSPVDGSSDTISFGRWRASPDRAATDIPVSFLRPPEGSDELGRLGDYRILRIIGKGGMGIVFEAEDIALGRRIALKVLRPDMSDEEFRQRFLREARAVASLTHEHIVTIYQVGEDNGVPFLAMELMRGESLESRLARDGWLPLADALDIARQAAEGLAVAHEKGLIHRDVKPDNLWLESGLSGPAGRVKLLDFGLARHARGPSELTAPGQVVGTPGYMAPEVVYGLPVDARSDLYALGCVLYRMLTGKIPFAEGAADTSAMLRAAAEKDLFAADSPAPGIPPSVTPLVRDLLSREPDSRPRDARAVIARLRELERSLPGSPAAASAPAMPRPKARLRDGARFGVWTGALSVLLALLVAAAVLVERVLAPGRAVPAEARESAPAIPGGDPIRIGLLYSATGSLAYSEAPVREATLQAIREINDAGGVLGRPIESVTEDGASDEEAFARAAEKLLAEEGAVTIFGCWSPSSRKRVTEVCVRHDRLLVYAVPDEGLDESPNVFCLGGTPNQLMIPAVSWVYTDRRKRRFYLAGSECVFSRATHEILRHEVETLGGQVVGEAFRPYGATDFSAVTADIEHSGADVVLCTIDGLSNVAFAGALRTRGLRPPAVPTVWFNVGENELRFIHDARKDMPGDYAPFCYFQSLDLPANKAFLERFRKAVHDPNRAVTDPMEMSYVSIYLWKQAVEAAGTTDTGPLREAFRKQSFDAPEGKVRVDPDSQRAWRTPRVGQINDRLDFDIVWAAPGPRAPEPYPPFRTRQQWDQFLQALYKGWGGHWEEHPR
jgi:urea transport system substrate-binding protein